MNEFSTFPRDYDDDDDLAYEIQKSKDVDFLMDHDCEGEICGLTKLFINQLFDEREKLLLNLHHTQKNDDGSYKYGDTL